MAVLSAYNIGLSFIERKLFQGVTFNVEERDKIGLIGANGTGKTTLLKILTGLISPDEGSVTTGKNTVLGYMQQHACTVQDRTVYDELLTVFEPLINMEKELEILPALIEKGKGDIHSLIEKQDILLTEFQNRGGLTYKSRTKSCLIGLGFREEDFSMEVGKLSGGQKSKLSLAKLLLSGANLLLLDEPTNHLDINAVGWLENFLKEFDGSAIIISHDRYFLDEVTNKTMEIYCKGLVSYEGNYSVFADKKAKQQESIRRKYENDIKEIKRIEGIIEQQKGWATERNFITAASKQKEVDRIKAQLVVPQEESHNLRFKFELKQESGEDVLICKDLSKSFGNNRLFSNLSFHLKKGEKVFIMGENGVGKTTLFKIITGSQMADYGYIDYGTGVKIGYFDQLQANLSLEKDSFSEIHDAFPDMTETQVRKALGRFGFRGDEVFKKMSLMSGGERAKVNLLKLMLQGDNLLLLDEPTNHLDLESITSLNKGMQNFKGAMLFATGDQEIIETVANRIIDIVDENTIIDKQMSYEEYMEKYKN